MTSDRTYDWSRPQTARKIKGIAGRGKFYGDDRYGTNGSYIYQCTAQHSPSGTRMIYTRDEQAHAELFGGATPREYRYCLHLSLSFLDPLTWEIIPRDRVLTFRWLECFFGSYQPLLFARAPQTEIGKARDCWHYYLFTRPNFSKPIFHTNEQQIQRFQDLGWVLFKDFSTQWEATADA